MSRCTFNQHARIVLNLQTYFTLIILNEIKKTKKIGKAGSADVWNSVSDLLSGVPDASCKRKATLPHCAVGNKIAFWWPFFIRGSVSRERTVEDTAAEGGGSGRRLLTVPAGTIEDRWKRAARHLIPPARQIRTLGKSWGSTQSINTT